MSMELAQVQQRREITAVLDPVPVLDTAKFEHMQRIANVMARSSMIPETLRTFGPKDKKEELPFEQVLSNCFLVVNQAVRWGMDPFAVISCCSIVYGRLAYEGKLVAAVLEAKLGVHLTYVWNDQQGDAFGITVTGTLPDGRTESVNGTVGQWKTVGTNSPWGKQPKLQLAYRGAREWARLYAPGVMLGVYSEDELADLQEDARARRAVPVKSLAERLAISKPSGVSGFSREHVDIETGEITDTEEQRADVAGSTPGVGSESAPSGDEPGSSDQGSFVNGPGAAPDAPESESRPPHISGAADGGAHTDAPVDGGAVERLAAGQSPLSSQAASSLCASFGEALFRATQARSLKSIVEQFWEANEYPFDDVATTGRIDRIHAIHVRRLKAEISAKTAMEAIRDIVTAR